MSDRRGRILSASFGATDLPLPLSARVGRSCDALPAAGQADAFPTSVQTGEPRVTGEVRLRGIAAAEGLALGRIDTLTFTVAGARQGQPNRTATLAGAVLVGVETAFEQSGQAVATLRFVAEAPDGQIDPFLAEDAS